MERQSGMAPHLCHNLPGLGAKQAAGSLAKEEHTVTACRDASEVTQRTKDRPPSGSVIVQDKAFGNAFAANDENILRGCAADGM